MKELNLEPDKHTHTSEVPMVLKHGQDVYSPTNFRIRAEWVDKTSKFQDWLGGPDESRILCIQGHGIIETTSPMSLLISLLYVKLEQAPRTLVLPFFCGISKASYGPKSMLRALLAQLLDLCNTHGYTGKGGLPILSFLGHEERAQLKEQDCLTYTGVLALLLQELRKEYSAIFILIDGVDFYDSEFEEDIDDFVEGMRQLVERLNK